MAAGNHAMAAAREHQRLLAELYSAAPVEMHDDLQRALHAASLRARNADLTKPESAAAFERLAEHLDGCRRQALKLAQRIRSQQAGTAG